MSLVTSCPAGEQPVAGQSVRTVRPGLPHPTKDGAQQGFP